MAKYISKFDNQKNFKGVNGIEYYGPFNYNIDDEVDVAAEVIEILERWDCNYEYETDAEGMTWLVTRTCYEAGSLIEELFEELNAQA